MKVHPLKSDKPVIVYLDFKSPYAYLAVEPTRSLEKELGLDFDWRPFVLDIPSYLGSAELNEKGQLAEQNRSAAQWQAVKYAYYDCRRYASISGLTIRGTTKIWDTNLAATAMWWVRENAPDLLAAFIDQVYQPFWKRDLDIEDSANIAGIFQNLGLDSAPFISWAESHGSNFNSEFQQTAFTNGIYGVPTYVLGEDRLFGREHLPRIEWLLGANSGKGPDIANSLPDEPVIERSPSSEIWIGLDNTLDTLLAIPKLNDLLTLRGKTAVWFRTKSTAMDSLIPASDLGSRGETHRSYRERNAELNWQRYAGDIPFEENMATRIDELIAKLGLCIQSPPDDSLRVSPFPGVVVKIDEQLMIGRQHLPLISELLS